MTDTTTTASVQPKKGHDLWARALSEFAGSLLICFAIYLMCTFGSAFYNVNLAFVTVCVGVIYAAMTAIFARISGAQFNPAVTVAAMLTSKTKVWDGICYIVAQILGAIVAGGLLRLVLPTSESVAANQWYAMAVNGYDKGSSLYTSLNSLGLTFSITVAIIVELLASIIVVAAAMVSMRKHGKVRSDYALVMGVAYAAASAMSFPVTGASINPARATGIAVFAQGQGLTQEPLAQLWVFWVTASLAAAIVALVIIVSQLLGTPKTSVDSDVAEAAMAQAGEVPAEDEAEAVQIAEAENYNVPLTGEQTDNDYSVIEEEDAEEETEQDDSQTDSADGVERH